MTFGLEWVQKMDLFFNGLWKALQEALERLLGSLGGLLGGSMFHD